MALAAQPLLAAPGEDPLILDKPVQYMMMPLNNAKKSQGLDTQSSMPSHTRAKVARYTAKALASESSGIATDSDVVTSTTQKTCVQQVGVTTTDSSTLNSYGPSQQEQVVVLRGDLINVCN